MLKRLAAALAATLLLGASPAAADDPAPAWPNSQSCDVPGFINDVTDTDPDDPDTWLWGWIEPCGWPAPAEDRFGFIHYVWTPGEPGLRAYVSPSRLRPYDPVRRTYFLGTIDTAVAQGEESLVGVCLAYAVDAPIACHEMPRGDGEEDRPALPAPSELTNVRVYDPGPYRTDPNCATCV